MARFPFGKSRSIAIWETLWKFRVWRDQIIINPSDSLADGEPVRVKATKDSRPSAAKQ